jgi:hypothetical protein
LVLSRLDIVVVVGGWLCAVRCMDFLKVQKEASFRCSEWFTA